MAHEKTIAMMTGRARIVVFCIAAFAVVVGIAARLDDLDHRLFWQDEAFSMLRITGHEQPDLDRLFDGRTHAASDVLATTRLDAHLGIAATLASLRNEPQRGPLFYVAARAWADVFGDTVARMRLLSACIGVAAVGFAFLLGRCMAGGAIGGAVLAALVAIAPIELRFSQQLREYETIAALALASAWLLLRAVERPAAARFAAYAASVLLGFFASPIFGAVVAAHAVVMAVAARRDGRALFGWWLAAVVVATLAYAPWALGTVATAGAHANDLAWLIGSYSLRSFALKWAFNAGAVFFDAEFARARYGLVLIPILACIAGAFVSAFAWPRDAVARALALSYTLCTIVPLVALDVVRHAHFESVTRYQMTTWVGIDLIVALLVVRGLTAGGNGARAAIVGFAFAVGCGTFSAVFARPYAVWWENNEHLDERAAGASIAAAIPAVVVATKNGAAEPYALVLSRYVPPDTPMLLYGGALPALPGATRLFFFAPDASVVREVDRRVAPARVLRNVSPAIGLTIPDLRAPRDAQAAAALRADNALWRIGSAAERDAR